MRTSTENSTPSTMELPLEVLKSLLRFLDLIMSSNIVLILLTVLLPHSMVSLLTIYSSAQSDRVVLSRSLWAKRLLYCAMKTSRPCRQQKSLTTESSFLPCSSSVICLNPLFNSLSRKNAIKWGVFLLPFIKSMKA